jgi:hypothetical protein
VTIVLTLRSALRAQRSDAGLSIIEVVIALMVFSLMTVGGVVAVATSLTMTSDARGREVAANMAAQEIDRVRSQSDIFAVLDDSSTTTLNGTAYTVRRSASWVSTTGVDSLCGAAGGALLYKRINVTVTWDGMKGSTLPVRADTVLAPGSKINDPAFGTILVSVSSITGSGGTAGVSVSITPSAVSGNTALPLAAQPDRTDQQGCSYALKVAPGTYDVSVTRTDAPYRDERQKAVSTKTVGVAAGGSGSAGFTYDLAGQFPVRYAPDAGGAAQLPAQLTTTFLSTYEPFATTDLPPVQYLSPISSGYRAVAGTWGPASLGAASCLSTDAESWPVAGDGAVGKPLSAVAAKPGQQSDGPVSVRMGVVRVKLPANVKFVKATTTSAIDDDPGCRAGMSYTFDVSAANARGNNNSVDLALPFGSWSFQTGTTANNVSAAVAYTSLAPQTRGRSVFDISRSFNAVLLDPREAP